MTDISGSPKNYFNLRRKVTTSAFSPFHLTSASSPSASWHRILYDVSEPWCQCSILRSVDLLIDRARPQVTVIEITLPRIEYLRSSATGGGIRRTQGASLALFHTRLFSLTGGDILARIVFV
jgi:hypothetical protein